MPHLLVWLFRSEDLEFNINLEEPHPCLPRYSYVAPPISLKNCELAAWPPHSRLGLSITWQHGRDGQNFIGTVEFAAGDDHLGQLRVQGELGHHGAQLRQIPVVIERCQVVQQLQGSHQGLWSWRRQKCEEMGRKCLCSKPMGKTHRGNTDRADLPFLHQNNLEPLLTPVSGVINALVLQVKTSSESFNQSTENYSQRIKKLKLLKVTFSAQMPTIDWSQQLLVTIFVIVNGFLCWLELRLR